MADFTGIRRIDRLLEDADEKLNRHGNRVRHVFHHSERYLFDCNMDMEEWMQFDTRIDAWYYGVWVNKAKRRILTYVEGDVAFTQCDSDETYDAEMAAMCSYYGEASATSVIDVDEKTMTRFYQDQSQFFIDPEKGRAFKFTGEPRDGEV